MKTEYSFIDPGAIMGVVVSLIILAVGVFAFFVTINEIPAPEGANGTENMRIRNAINNTSDTADSVFNIIGIVLIIGAIMSIVGLVYNYVR